MNFITYFIQLFIATTFYYGYAMSSILYLDFFENTFSKTNYASHSSILLVLQVVLRLTLNVFFIHYLPETFDLVNTRLLSGIFDRDIIYKTAIIYSITNITFDSNLIEKCTELRKRMQKYLASPSTQHKSITLKNAINNIIKF